MPRMLSIVHIAIGITHRGTIARDDDDSLGAQGGCNSEHSATGDKTVVCTVTDAQTESIKVTCPPDSGLENGADVKFQFPK